MIYTQLTIPPATAINAVAGASKTISAVGWREAVPILYGEPRVGALILNVLPAGTGATTYLVQCLWGVAGGGVTGIKLNGADLPAGSSTTHYDGTQVTADAALVTAFAAQGITYSDALTGYAYSVLTIPTKTFDGRLDVTALVKGRKLYDPRKDTTMAGGSGAHRLATPSTWEWSDNPSLADANFLADADHGCGVTVDWASVMTAAAANDALVGGSEKRRTLNLALTGPAGVEDVADALRAYAGVWHVAGSAGMRLVPDADGASVATYAHDSGTIAGIAPLVMRDAGSSPTVVEVVYTDTSTVPWQQASRTASLAGAGSTLPWRISVVQLPGITRSTQAYREAVERLNKLTLAQFNTSVEVFDEGIKHEPGDLVTISHPIGLSAQKMRATDVEMTARGRWRLTVAQHSALAYSDAVVSLSAPAVASPLVDPGPPINVAGLSISNVAGGARIKWTGSTELDYAYTELRVGASWAAGTPLGGGTAGTGTRIAGNEFVWLAPAQGSYTIRAKHFDITGTESATDTALAATVDANSLVSYVPFGKNMLYNSAFEAGVAGWSETDNAGFTPTVGTNLSSTWRLLPTDAAWSSALYIEQLATATNGAWYGGRGSNKLLVKPSTRYIISGYVQPRRCTGAIFVRGYTSAGVAIGSMDGAGFLSTTLAEQTDANTLAKYVRLASDFTTTSDCAYVRFYIRKYDTSTGPSSYLFATRLMLEEATDDSSVGEWAPGPDVPNGGVTTGGLADGAATDVVSDSDTTVSTTLGAGASGTQVPVSFYWENTLGYDVPVEVSGSANFTVTNTNATGTTRVDRARLTVQEEQFSGSWSFVAERGEANYEKPVPDIAANGVARFLYSRFQRVTVPAGRRIYVAVDVQVTNLSGAACTIVARDPWVTAAIIKR